jgi:phage shock protein C
MKKLYRSSKDIMISGVLGGIAEFYDVDPTIVRLVFAGIAVFTAGFPGVLLYIIATIVIPIRPDGQMIDVEPLSR